MNIVYSSYTRSIRLHSDDQFTTMPMQCIKSSHGNHIVDREADVIENKNIEKLIHTISGVFSGGLCGIRYKVLHC